MPVSHKQQLTLDIALRNEWRFDNFEVGENLQLLEKLKTINTHDFCYYLWGAQSSGKTHLLNALCQYFQEMRKAENKSNHLAYLSLAQPFMYTVEILEGLEAYPLVCIDNVDQIFANSEWELALFKLFNQLRDRDGILVLSAASPLSEYSIQLPDLKSRLSSALVFQIKPLDDESKARLLQQMARERGIKLEAEVIEFILNRGSRSMSELINLLDTLDQESLKQKRMITIPFVKSIFSW